MSSQTLKQFNCRVVDHKTTDYNEDVDAAHVVLPIMPDLVIQPESPKCMNLPQ